MFWKENQHLLAPPGILGVQQLRVITTPMSLAANPSVSSDIAPSLASTGDLPAHLPGASNPAHSLRSIDMRGTAPWNGGDPWYAIGGNPNYHTMVRLSGAIA